MIVTKIIGNVVAFQTMKGQFDYHRPANKFTAKIAKPACAGSQLVAEGRLRSFCRGFNRRAAKVKFEPNRQANAVTRAFAQIRDEERDV
jgi:hypothetical protein